MDYDSFIARLVKANSTQNNEEDIDRLLNSDVECFSCNKIVRAADEFDFSVSTGELKCPKCGVLWVKFE